MSIRVSEIPEANNSYILTNKKILVHDLTASPTGSTKLLDLGRIVSANINISDGDKGDITVSLLGTNWIIKNSVIGLNKLSQISAEKLLGNSSNITANVSEITLGSSLNFASTSLNVTPNTTVQKVIVQTNNLFIGSNSVLNFVQGSNISLLIYNDFANNRINLQFDGIALPVANGNYGDITVASSTVWTIKPNVITTTKVLNNAITYSKIQKLSGESLLGNFQSFTEDVTEIQLQPSLRFNGTFLEVTPDTSIQKVSILSGGALIGSRKAINFNFTNLGYSIIDDNVNNRVNLNLTGLSTTTSIYRNGVYVGAQSIINLIQGSNTSITAVNNIAQQRVDITLQGSITSLQDVTNIGSSTTNNLSVNNSIGLISVVSDFEFGEATIGQTDSSIGGYLRLANNAGNGTTLQVSNITAQRILQLPNGNGVIPLTVNGVGANSSGAIIIPAATGALYTPVLYPQANVTTAILNSATYIKIGNIVTIYLSINVAPTIVSLFSVYFDLPFPITSGTSGLGISAGQYGGVTGYGNYATVTKGNFVIGNPTTTVLNTYTMVYQYSTV